jgi:hypothetical protein
VIFPGGKERQGMRKIKLAVAAAAVAAGLLASPLAVGIANASTYSISFINRCAQVSGSANHDCIQLGSYATYTQDQVWINGHVYCNILSGGVTKTWCGVGGGNGTGALNIGVNFTFSGVTGLYERMNIFAGGNVNFGGDGQGCGTFGSNSNVQGHTIHWWNDDGYALNGYYPDNSPDGTLCEEPV